MSDTRFEEPKRMLVTCRQELQRGFTDKLAAVRASTGHESGRPEILWTPPRRPKQTCSWTSVSASRK